MSKRKVVPRKPKAKVAGLPTIKCECGQEILLVPDVKVMGKAIEAHAEWHKNREKDPAKAEEKANRVRDDLTAKVLQKAASIRSSRLDKTK